MFKVFISQVNDENPGDIELNDEEEYTKPAFDDLKKIETWCHQLPAIRTTGRITVDPKLNED